MASLSVRPCVPGPVVHSYWTFVPAVSWRTTFSGTGTTLFQSRVLTKELSNLLGKMVARRDLSPDTRAVSAGLRAIKRGAQSEEIVGLIVKSRAAFVFISTYAHMHVPIATSRQGYNVVQSVPSPPRHHHITLTPNTAWVGSSPCCCDVSREIP
jgi:hypothetical protein